MTTEQKLKGLDTSHLGDTSDDTRQKTHEDKRLIVNKNRIEEIERIRKINEQLNNDKIQEKEESEEYREPLSIEKEEVYKILLSWGGGADGFKLYFKDGELLNGIYFMADWGEYEESELTNEEANEVYNFYMFGEISAFKDN